MSMPNIPDVNPDIKLERHEVINLLLSSIAFEELGLAHIINAEGEKLQKLIETACDYDELIKANKSVEKMLRTIIKKEIILQFKLENVLEIPDMKHKEHKEDHKEKDKDKHHHKDKDHKDKDKHDKGKDKSSLV